MPESSYTESSVELRKFLLGIIILGGSSGACRDLRRLKTVLGLRKHGRTSFKVSNIVRLSGFWRFLGRN